MSGTDDMEGGHEREDEVEMYPDGNNRLTKMFVRKPRKLYHDRVLTGATENDQYLQDKDTRGHSDHTRNYFRCESSESRDEVTVRQKVTELQTMLKRETKSHSELMKVHGAMGFSKAFRTRSLCSEGASIHTILRQTDLLGSATRSHGIQNEDEDTVRLRAKCK